jgi:simple sugar transport system permease protein
MNHKNNMNENGKILDIILDFLDSIESLFRNSSFLRVLQTIFTLIVALIMGAIVIEISGKSSVEAYGALFRSSLGSKTAVANTLLAATPLIFTSLAAAIGFRAGIFNIGAEGSLYLGGFAAAWVGFTFTNLPAALVIPIAFFAAGLVGGLWLYFPAVLRSRLDVDELVTTILLNYVAILITDYLVNGPFLVPGVANAMTEEVSLAARLVRLAPPSQFNLSFIVAILAGIVMVLTVNKTKLGYELKAIGDNKIFSRWAGINVPWVIEEVMVIGGILGGLAGAGQVLGVHYRFVAGFSSGLAFTGMTIALLVHNSPVGAIVASILFGILRNGSSTMEIFTDVPRDLIRVLEATIIFFAAMEFRFSWLRRRRHDRTDNK